METNMNSSLPLKVLTLPTSSSFVSKDNFAKLPTIWAEFSMPGVRLRLGGCAHVIKGCIIMHTQKGAN